MHEGMLNITHHQRHTNQNHNRISTKMQPDVIKRAQVYEGWTGVLVLPLALSLTPGV